MFSQNRGKGGSSWEQCQPVHRVPASYGEDANSEEPEERRGLVHPDAEAAKGPQPVRHVAGDGEEEGEDEEGEARPHLRPL